MKIYDMHCHVDLMSSMTGFASDAQKADIGILAVTTTPKAYEKEIFTLKSFLGFRVALGLHPQLIAERYSEISLFEKYVKDAHFIGEVGLDFNRQFYHSKDKQLDAFENIIKWCGLIGGKVVSIHSVHADKQILDAIERHSAHRNNTIILHWFSGTAKQLQRAVEMGCYFSINSVMTQSANGQKIIKSIPAECLFLESDAPFVGEINTSQKLLADLNMTLNWLSGSFGTDVSASIVERSKNIIG